MLLKCEVLLSDPGRGSKEMKIKQKTVLSVLSVLSAALFAGTFFPMQKSFAETSDKIVMNTIFSDHMVLQRDKKVEIYGETSAGAEVEVTFKGQTKRCTADASGNFSVCLDEMPADSEGEALTVTAGTAEKTFSDVLVGEVYYASGQSNMAYPFDEYTYAESVIKNDPSYGEDYEKYNSQPSYLENYRQYGNYHLLRFYMQKMMPETSGVINKGTQNVWLTAEGVEDLTYVSLTAVAYAIHLSEKLGDVPVGVAVAAVGGSQIHEWISDDSAAKIFPGSGNTTLSQRYNHMLVPMGRFTYRGILWYQGESDVYGDAETYRACFSAWAEDTRRFLGDELPVLLFQLPQYEDAGCSGLWAPFRQLQEEIAGENAGVYYVCGIDLGDHTNIHPLQKWEFCERAAGLALEVIYGKEYGGSGSYGKSPVVSGLYRKSGTKQVYMRFENASALSVSEGVTRGLIATTNKQSYVEIDSFEQVDETTIAFDTGLKYISYLQNNIFPYDTAFIHNEYGLPAAPFVDREVTVYDFDVTVTLEGCATDGDCRYFVGSGDTVAFQISPYEGYEPESFTVNGEEREFGDGTVTLSDIREDVAVICRFRPAETELPDSSGDTGSDSSSDNSSDDVWNSAGTDSSGQGASDSSTDVESAGADGGKKGCGSAFAPMYAAGAAVTMGWCLKRKKFRG